MTDSEFHDAFRNHKDVVYRFAYRMTGSVQTAEDVVQDCFIALWRKPGAYDPLRGSLRSFLLGTTRNLVLKRWRDVRDHDVLEPESISTPAFDLEKQERSQIVAAAVQRLPTLQREALIFAEYEEMSLEEIATTTQTELAAVKSRLHRARENLRKILAPLLAPNAGDQKGIAYETRKG